MFDFLEFPYRCSHGRADSIKNSHTTGLGLKTRCVLYTSYRASDWLSSYQHHRVEHLLVCVGEGFADRVWPKTLKWVFVYSSVTFHINGKHNGRSALCMYTVTGCGVMSCVCSMKFLCGSTLVKVPLLQVGTVTIWPQMLNPDKQTNKQTNSSTVNYLRV